MTPPKKSGRWLRAGFLLAALIAIANIVSHIPPAGHRGDSEPSARPASGRDFAQGSTTSLSGASASGARGSVPRSFRVVAQDGAPVEGAVISVTDASLLQLDSLTESQIDKATATVQTTTEGTFQLPRLPTPSEIRPVIWITHPQFYATDFSLGDQDLQLPEAFTLKPSRELVAKVLGPDGLPAAGAQVIQRGSPSLEPALSGPPRNLDADNVLLRTTITRESGTASLCRASRAIRVQARLRDLRSSWLLVGAEEHVILDLRPTFSVAGRIVVDSGTHLDSPIFIHCGIQHGVDSTIIDSVQAHPDLTWGPVQLPLVPTSAYSFLIEGTGIAAEQVLVSPPRAGENITVDFHPERGQRLDVQVTDEKEQTLTGATVSVLWNSDGTWTRLEHHTTSDGIATFMIRRSGEIWVRARHAGFARVRLDSFEASAPPPNPLVVALTPTGRLEGTCSHNGIPVDDFTIVYWSVDPARKEYVDFHDRSDGSFVVDDAPCGDLTVLGFSTSLPSSPPQHVTLLVGEPSNVAISLPSPLIGRGRVVDALTGEPLRDALIQVNVLFENVILRPWGPPRPVGASGEFSIGGFVPGYNGLLVSAPGYAQRSVVINASPDVPLDFGLLGLFSTQHIDVELRSDRPTDWSPASIELIGTRTIGPKRFQADGHIRIPGLEPGPYILRMFLPNANLIDAVTLLPGRDLCVTERIIGRSLAVDVVPEAQVHLPKKLLLRVEFTRASGNQISYTSEIPSDLHVDIGHVEGNHVLLSVEDWDGHIYGSELIALGPREPSRVGLHVSNRQGTLHVVDSHLQPVEGAHIMVSLPGERGRWLQQVDTDPQGQCLIAIPKPSSAFVSVYHFSLGLEPSILLDLGTTGDAPITLELSPDRHLQLMLLERLDPAPHIEVWAEDIQGVTLGLGEGTSDETGLVRWGPVGQGDYRIRIDQPGYWQSSTVVNLNTQPGPIQVQVRRLGSVLFYFKSPVGNPVMDALVELTSDEFGDAVSSWLATGKAVSSTGKLRSGSDGQLRLSGLPNGAFHWRATTDNGTLMEGVANVPPNGVVQVEVVIP